MKCTFHIYYMEFSNRFWVWTVYFVCFVVYCGFFKQSCFFHSHCNSVEFWPLLVQYISAVTRDFQQCGILTSVGSDEPVQLPFRLRNLKWCSVSSLTLKGYSNDKQWLWSDCSYEYKLIWGFAGRTCHIVGNFMHCLIYLYHTLDKIAQGI